MKIHTILGAGGTTANELTKVLLQNGQKIRLVSKHRIATKTKDISWKRGDLMKYHDVLEAVKGSAIVYICNEVGYSKADWKSKWPVVMTSVIDACKQTQARVIFVDDPYMYGKVCGKITEETPYNPCSFKGEVQAEIALQFMNEIKAGNLRGAIARAPGFYGTDSMQSILDAMVLNRFSKKLSAKWFGDIGLLHNFGYMPDIAKSIYLLGKHTEGDGQIWHTPTAAPMTGVKFIETAAKIYKTAPAYIRVNKWMLRVIALFHQAAACQVELFYCWEHDYNFVSSKFEKFFELEPTSYELGITQLSKTLYKKQTN